MYAYLHENMQISYSSLTAPPLPPTRALSLALALALSGTVRFCIEGDEQRGQHVMVTSGMATAFHPATHNARARARTHTHTQAKLTSPGWTAGVSVTETAQVAFTSPVTFTLKTQLNVGDSAVTLTADTPYTFLSTGEQLVVRHIPPPLHGAPHPPPYLSCLRQ